MSESILKALMRLFAIIANSDEEGSSARSVVESYLKMQLSQKLIDKYLELFDEFYAKHHSKKGKKRVSSNSVKVLMICEQINEELRQEQKILALIELLEFINFDNDATELELEFVKTVAETFNISEEEYNDCKSLVIDNVDDFPNKENVLIIDNNKDFNSDLLKHICNEHIEGQLIVINIKSTNMYAFRYAGSETLYLNGHVINPKKIYIFDKGSSIRNPKISPVYYSDVVGTFLKDEINSKVNFDIINVDFKFKNSENGIQRFNLHEESGHLVGVMGGSGAGKSTLLNVLNGTLEPQKGKILINGFNLYTEPEKVEGVIGFIPQDDLLIEELTVFQNLYYNAKLCFNEYNNKELIKATNKVLKDLNLYEIKDLKVGGPLNKFISGGQRKRLNIALELIREPLILFVDEPTSGLSSMDSEMVMDLLKEQALKGKLIIVNIHQPSSDIYKLFDKLMIMDRGGHTIYYGNPIDAITYFKKETSHINADVSECLSCGNVNPETVLSIVETRVVDEYGKLTHERKYSPKEWYKTYQEKIDKEIPKPQRTELPTSKFHIPGLLKQFIIFLTRDVLSKLTNRQYLLLNFLEAPVLATILGYFTKYIALDEYIFSDNENIPGYMFMAVIVSLFLGMTVSAEEIIKDRRILQRESFLNLSRFSYINSKVLIMFFLSAVQTFSFVLIANYILGINDLTFEYWIILFSTSAFANILGLNISSGLNSVVTIYILIPFILVPQLLLSGTIVKFDKLHKSISSHQFVPFVGDVMTSRWAYEAMAVVQAKSNKYTKHFFEIEQEKSSSQFRYNYLIPELETKLYSIDKNIGIDSLKELTTKDLLIIKNEIIKLQKNKGVKKFKFINDLTTNRFTPKISGKTHKYLNLTKKIFVKRFSNASRNMDKRFRELSQEFSEEEIIQLKRDNFNNSLSDMVTNKQSFKRIFETDNGFVQVMDPIYKMPESNYGRAHFYSPYKKIFGKTFETIWFNVMVIWSTILLLYFTLYFDVLKKLINISESFKKKK